MAAGAAAGVGGVHPAPARYWSLQPSTVGWFEALDYRNHQTGAWSCNCCSATHPQRTWVMKAPSHLAHLDLVLAMYTDARIVVCHRDPLAMISAVTSLTATLLWGHAASVDYHALARENMDQFGRNLDAVTSA